MSVWFLSLIHISQYDPETARIRRALRAQKARRRKKMRSRRLFLLGIAGNRTASVALIQNARSSKTCLLYTSS